MHIEYTYRGLTRPHGERKTICCVNNIACLFHEAYESCILK